MPDLMLSQLEQWLWSGAVVHRADVAAVARMVSELSDLYTVERGLIARQQGESEHLPAKVLYFLASDAPKTAMVLNECAARDAAFASPRRVVDLGCGVGATSVGLLQHLASRGWNGPEPIRIVGIDHAPATLRLWPLIVGEAARIAGIPVLLDVVHGDLASAAIAGDTDLILCQTALNERLPGNRSHELTFDVATQALVGSWARAAPLVLIEPALRATTRPLHRLRDAMLREGGIRVVAPCPHALACPMLVREGDWCHESRRIEPTPMVAQVQAITRRRDERSLFSFVAFAPGSAATPNHDAMRLVSDPLGSRGKTERWACCEDGRLRLFRLLDRERRPENELLLEAERGAMVRIDPTSDSDRIGPEFRVISIRK